jgi:poly-gamma-glutamate synthesis protein (capsule biosynthesis protein)
MDRREFLQSTGKLALLLATPVLDHLMAATENAADPSPVPASRLTLFLCGDMMTGRGIDQVLPHPSDPQIHEDYMQSALGYVQIAEAANGPIPRHVDPTYIWGEALRELDRLAPDLRIVNLETSVTASDDYWPGKGINYRMHPANVPALQAAAIDCCVLANNHVLDWGYAGLDETLKVLDDAGIATAGAGRNVQQAGAPAIFDPSGKGRVLVFAAGSPSSGVPREWAATAERAGVNYIADYSSASVEAVARQVEAHKQPGDTVVLSIHWGGNWGYTIPAAQQEFAHRLIDEAGIDLIHGHSSHHPRAIEVYHDKPILYGCGDFLNDYEGIGGREAFRAELTLMYFISFERPRGALAGLKMIPLRIRNFRLIRATTGEADWLAATLDRECRRYGSAVKRVDGRSLVLDPG